MSVFSAKYPHLKVALSYCVWIFWRSQFHPLDKDQTFQNSVPQPPFCTTTFLAVLSNGSFWKLFLWEKGILLSLSRGKRVVERLTCLLMKFILITVSCCKGRGEAKVCKTPESSLDLSKPTKQATKKPQKANPPPLDLNCVPTGRTKCVFHRKLILASFFLLWCSFQ